MVGDVACLVDDYNGVFTVRRDDGVINQRRDDIFRIVFVGVRGVLIGEDIAVIILVIGAVESGVQQAEMFSASSLTSTRFGRSTSS